jgi:hypothetical protein
LDVTDDCCGDECVAVVGSCVVVGGVGVACGWVGLVEFFEECCDDGGVELVACAVEQLLAGLCGCGPR